MSKLRFAIEMVILGLDSWQKQIIEEGKHFWVLLLQEKLESFPLA